MKGILLIGILIWSCLQGYAAGLIIVYLPEIRELLKELRKSGIK